MINIVFLISIQIRNGSKYYILLISTMQSEDSPEKSFEAEMSAIVSAFIRDFPNKLQSPSQRRSILESVSSLLRNEGRMQELIEYDINKSPSHSLSLASHSQQEQEEASASHHIQSKNLSKNKIRMIDLSEHYEDSIFKHSHLESHSSEEREMETTLMPNQNNCKTLPRRLTLRKSTRENRRINTKEMIKIEESTPLYKRDSFSSEDGSAEEESWTQGPVRSLKLPSGRRPEFPKLQMLLISWIYSEINQGHRVTQLCIRNMAMEIVNRFPGSRESKFKASKGWMHKFLRRHPAISRLLSMKAWNKWARYVEKDERIDDEQVNE